MKSPVAAAAASVCGVALSHFFCCGLPLISVIFGASIPFASVLSGLWVTIAVMSAAGITLAISWVHYFRKCKCHETTLIISTVLFLFGLVWHLID